MFIVASDSQDLHRESESDSLSRKQNKRDRTSFYKHSVPTGLAFDSLQQLGIDSGFAFGNHCCSDSRLIELDWPCAADDAIDITELSQSPERCDQQRPSNAAAAFIFSDARRPKER